MFLSGSNCPLSSFPAVTTRAVIASIKATVDLETRWTSTSTNAFIIGTFTSITATQSIQIGTILYVFVASLGTADGQVLIGSDVNASLNNLKDAINRSSTTLGTAYTASTIANPEISCPSVSGSTIRLESINEGGAGNGLAVSGIGTWAWGGLPGNSINRLLYGGWRFRYRSDQGLVILVSIWDDGPHAFSSGSIQVQFQSGISDLVGYVHGIDVPSPSGQLQCLINGGSMFISNPGTAGTPGFGRQGMSCCGGLLHITKFGTDIMPTEAWWSSGDGVGSPFFMAESPRTNLYWNFFPNLSQSSEGIWNGVRTGDLGALDPAIMRIVPKNAADEEMTAVVCWTNDDPLGVRAPLVYDAQVAFGNAPGDQPLIRGTIPDARISSIPEDCDTTITDGSGSWINYTHQYVKGGLWLRYNATATPSTVQLSGAQYRKPFNLGTDPTI